jgi:hypothetical protein
MPECSCRGTNPNCFKCDGWGRLGDEIAQQRVNPDHLPLSPGKSAPQKIVRLQRKVLRISDPQKNRTPKASKKMVTCYCKAVLSVNSLDRHLENAHRLGKEVISIFRRKVIKDNLSVDNVKKTLNNKKRNISNENEIDDVVQSPFETRFGDKFLGYFAREKGKYGSISLYDDYGDESNSD